VYHVGAVAQIWPQANRQSYGLGIVDSVVSSSRLAGGLAGTYTRQDPDGADRTAIDVRFALAYPFSDAFYLGAAGRYLSLDQEGYPRGLDTLRPSVAAGGLNGEAIVQTITFDAGLTLKPMPELSLSLVGQNLTDPGTGFLPLMLGGGAAFGNDDFTIEADAVGDFTSWSGSTMRAMGGGELLVADHFPLRLGYRYDEGATSHAVTGGLGYLDRAYSVDLAIQRVVSGEPVTVIVIGFKYHVESTGIGGASDGY
jgi:opacity protein-like surface antigen